jgi:hypothetical protein
MKTPKSREDDLMSTSRDSRLSFDVNIYEIAALLGKPPTTR